MEIDSGLIERVGVAAVAVLSLLALWMSVRLRREMAAQRTADREGARVELQAQVESRTQEFAELARHLQSAREDERSRLARALHDELGSLLTAAKLDVARIKSRVATTAPEALERLGHLNETLNSVIALTRRITEDLRPSTLGNLGLTAALEILAREFGSSAGVRIEVDLQPVSLSAQNELTIFRLVQEALTNVAKYARATSVRITLAPSQGFAKVSVVDDGVGFDTRDAKVASFGLLGMRYRVEGEGGQLFVESRPGAGTRLGATLPLLAAG
ncbi:MAG: sensor histidine kinase [Rubrivivax sp.]|nr:sensor histidine kinase [Rubrivivax sp.]